MKAGPSLQAHLPLMPCCRKASSYIPWAGARGGGAAVAHVRATVVGEVHAVGQYGAPQLDPEDSRANSTRRAAHERSCGWRAASPGRERLSRRPRRTPRAPGPPSTTAGSVRSDGITHPSGRVPDVARGAHVEALTPWRRTHELVGSAAVRVVLATEPAPAALASKVTPDAVVARLAGAAFAAALSGPSAPRSPLPQTAAPAVGPGRPRRGRKGGSPRAAERRPAG